MNIAFSYIINPEKDRISRLPINFWVDSLKEDFINQVNNNDDLKKFISLQLITNQLALILFIINEVELAKKLCLNAQKYFFNIYVREKIFYCNDKFGILQPWINLIRIERFLKNFSASYTKLESLKLNESHYKLDDYIVDKKDLSIEAQQLLTHCYIDEKVKLLIDDDRYIQLDDFLEECIKEHSNSYQIFLFLEARVIAMFNSAQRDLIPNFIDDIIAESPKDEKNLFKLKLVHYYINVKNNDLALEALEELYSEFFITLVSPLYILRFWLMVGKTCYELAEFKKMSEIFNNLYKPLLIKNDELSLWEISILMKDTIYSDLRWELLAIDSTYSATKAKISKNYLWHEKCTQLNAHVNEYLYNPL